jgi:hypothetical protein
VRERVEGFKKDGWCESTQMVALPPHGGDLNGFILLNGERAKLDELRRTDEFESFSMKLSSLMTSYGVIPSVTGEGLDKVAQRQPHLFK